MKTSSTITICIAAVLAAAGSALALAGCSQRASDIVYVVAVDRSESTAPFRADVLDDVDMSARAAVARDASLEIWVYGKTADLAPVPANMQTGEAIREVKADWLIPDPNHPQIRTRPRALLVKLCAEMPQWSASDVRLIILTDGDNDYAGDEPAIKYAAHALNRCSRLHVSIIGIHQENRAWWLHLVGSQLPGRLTLNPETAHESAMQAALTAPEQGE